MKIAVIGNGKTGSEVTKLIPESNLLGPFSRSYPITEEFLLKSQAVIVFVPGQALEKYLPILLKAKCPIISGITGVNLTDPIIQEKIKSSKTVWVQANNFSILMNLLRPVLNYLGSFSRQLPSYQFRLDETHHTHKKDAPSGTALLWKEWFGDDLEIQSFRQGDTVGEHILSVSNHLETFEVKHVSHDRKLFAQGALWASQLACELKLRPGYYSFEEIIRIKFKTSEKLNG